MPALSFLFSFSGRLERSRFWALVFIAFAEFIVAVYLLDVFGGPGGSIIAVGLALILALAFVVTLASASVRRLHDIGASAWYIVLMPLVLVPFLIVVGSLGSDGRSNKWGPPAGS